MRRVFVLAGLLIVCIPGFGAKVLAGLDFSSGHWALVGVSLHNYKSVPEQAEFGTFVIHDQELMAQIQQSWDLEPYFFDYCDYHYILKFYRDKVLIRSLKVNLSCNYITDGAFSYKFPPTLFQVFKTGNLQKVPWSRIRYRNVKNLRIAVDKLANDERIYFYQDMKPYVFDGYFVVSEHHIPLTANRDSLLQAVNTHLTEVTGSTACYTQPYLFFLNALPGGGNELTFNFTVYSNRDFAQRYSARLAVLGQRSDILAGWRSHIQDEPFLQIIVVGVNEDRYWTIIGPETFDLPGVQPRNHASARDRPVP